MTTKEELVERLKEPKGIGTQYEGQQYQLCLPFRGSGTLPQTKVYTWARPCGVCYIDSRKYGEKNCLICHLWDGRQMVLWKLDIPEKGDARGLK